MIPKGKNYTFIFTQKPPWLSRSKPLNGKPEATAAEKRSPNQRESYKVATNRESVSTPKWPEDSSVKITKE